MLRRPASRIRCAVLGSMQLVSALRFTLVATALTLDDTSVANGEGKRNVECLYKDMLLGAEHYHVLM